MNVLFSNISAADENNMKNIVSFKLQWETKRKRQKEEEEEAFET